MRVLCCAALGALACTAAAPPRAPAGTAVRVRYYPVAGEDVTALRRALRTEGPKDAAGRPRAARTDWSLAYRYALRPAPQQCRVARLETSLDVTITLPSLREPVPEPVQSRWDAFASALAAHEDGHRRIALACRDALESRLAAVAPAGDCEALREALESTGREAVAECRARDAGFDEDTGHGTEAGSRF
jgi:predicted secreted Zn-dependent protease